MSQTLQQTTVTPLPGELFGPLRAWGASVLARLAVRRRQMATRTALAKLSDAQLRDVGAERWASRPAQPPLAVDAATMRRLMSLR